MRITLDLEPADIARFQTAFDHSRRLASSADEIDVVAATRQALADIAVHGCPSYLRSRLIHVEHMMAMLEDDRWSLPEPERHEVLAALVYFSDPDDLIPDHLEGIGLLDDAIMIELMARRLRHVLRSYKAFCEFCDELGRPPRARNARMLHARRITERRGELQRRMQRRERLRSHEIVDALLIRNAKRGK